MLPECISFIVEIFKAYVLKLTYTLFSLKDFMLVTNRINFENCSRLYLLTDWSKLGPGKYRKQI